MKVPNEMKEIYADYENIITKFCDEFLNDEYKNICLLVLVKLCRKRTSPLLKGKIYTWSAGIIYAVGQINFLFEKSSKPYISSTDLCDYFGLSTSTVGNKAKEIRDLLKMKIFSLEYSIGALKIKAMELEEFDLRLKSLFENR